MCSSAPVCGDKCCLQDALPPLTRMVPAGSGWGRADAKEKQFFLFSSRKEGELSPSSLPVAAAWHLLSHCPLTGLVDHPFTTRGCRSVDHQQPLSLLSCWFAWQGPGCVLACPTESGPLLKMVANNVCGLPGKHVVELSL